MSFSFNKKEFSKIMYTFHNKTPFQHYISIFQSLNLAIFPAHKLNDILFKVFIIIKSARFKIMKEDDMTKDREENNTKNENGA